MLNISEFVVRTCVAPEADSDSSPEGQSAGDKKIILPQTAGIGLSDYSSCVASKQRHNEIVRLYQVRNYQLSIEEFLNVCTLH